MCIYASNCKPNEQMLPSEEHPYGTEWVFCKKDGIVRHRHCLCCVDRKQVDEEFSEEQIIEMYSIFKSLRATSIQIGCSATHVKKILKKHNLYEKKVSKVEIIKQNKEFLLDLRYKCYTYEQITYALQEKTGVKFTATQIGDLIKQWMEGKIK